MRRKSDDGESEETMARFLATALSTPFLCSEFGVSDSVRSLVSLD